MPGIGAGVVIGALVAAGIVPLSSVFYLGVFGAMILMHLGGHGMHGMHGGPSGHEMHGIENDEALDEEGDGRPRSDADGPDGEKGSDEREERSSHGCH